jgi:hypothetical protein
MVWMPKEFYRVESSSSVSCFSEEEGILAGDTTWFPNNFHDKMAVEAAIGRHLDWYNQIPTPFISMSSSLNKTRTEANRRKDRGYGNVRVIVINRYIVESKGGKVVNVEGMLKTMGLTIPPGVKKWLTSTEYVAFNIIHPSAVTSVHDAKGFEEFCNRKTLEYWKRT